MKKIILLITTCLLYIFTHSSFAVVNQTQIVVDKQKPKGVIIEKHKVKAQSGYMFKRVSVNKAVVMHKPRGGRGGVITGEFACGCDSSTTGSGCKLIIDSTSVWCSTLDCGAVCKMTVAIPSSSVIMH